MSSSPDQPPTNSSPSPPSSDLSVPFLLACLSILVSHVSLVVSHARSKPIIQITLNDLVNLDLTYSYFMAFATAITINLLLSLGADNTPHLLALALAESLNFWTYCLLAYFTVGILVQFALIRLRRVDLFENLDERRVRTAVRVGVGLLALTISLSFLVVYGGTSSSIFYYRLTGQDRPAEFATGFRPTQVMVAMAVVSFYTNLILRIFILCKRHADRHHLPYCSFVVFSVVFGAVLDANAAASQGWGGVDRLRVTRHIMVGTFCAALPLLSVVQNDGLRQHARKKLGRILSCCCPTINFVQSSSQVHPWHWQQQQPQMVNVMA